MIPVVGELSFILTEIRLVQSRLFRVVSCLLGPEAGCSGLGRQVLVSRGASKVGPSC